MTQLLLATLIQSPVSAEMTEPISASPLWVGTVFAIMGSLGLLALLTVPLLRTLGMVIGTVRWVMHKGPQLWTRPMAVVDPKRPLLLAGLSPGLTRLARQTRTLALELRRRSEAARHWPDDAAELEVVRVSWWSSFVTEIADFTPLMDTRREVFDWLDSVENLELRDREALEQLGIQAEAVREALNARSEVSERIRALAGLLWAIDERLAGVGGQGYRASGHAASQARGSAGLVGLPGSATSVWATEADDDDDQDPEVDARARRRSFANLLGRHGRGLSRMAGSYARGAAEREDLEQDIALALWQSLPKFRGESKLETFAYRVARYCCYRHVRRRGRLPVSDDAPVELIADSGDPGCVEQQLLDADTRAQVERALSELPDTLESTLSLHLSGLSYAEIAERLGISERNVSVRLTRARHRLRAQLAAA